MSDLALLILAAPIAIGALTGVGLAIWGDRLRPDNDGMGPATPRPLIRRS